MKKKIVLFFLVILLLLPVSLPVYGLSETYSVNEYYFTQLSKDEKNIYSAFKHAVVGGNQEFAITGLSQISNHFILEKKGLSSESEIKEEIAASNEFNTIAANITNAFQTVLDAFLLDHPEYFWVDGSSCGVNIRYSTQNYNPAVGKLEVQVSFSGILGIKSGYENYEQLYSSVIGKIKTIKASGNRYNQLKAIHDFLCAQIFYDKTAARCGDAAGALLDGRAVCQGYAHAFKIACDYYGIPCICVSGKGVSTTGTENHMWNYVQMENGAWYAIDCTWDDGENKIYYDYFLSGSATVDTYFGKNTFADTHLENGYQTLQSIKEFIYPSLSKAAYEYSENSSDSQTKAPTVTENTGSEGTSGNASATQIPENSGDSSNNEQTAGAEQPLEQTTALPEENKNENYVIENNIEEINENENAGITERQDSEQNNNRFLWILIPVLVVALGAACAAVIVFKKRKVKQNQESEDIHENDLN